MFRLLVHRSYSPKEKGAPKSQTFAQTLVAAPLWTEETEFRKKSDGHVHQRVRKKSWSDITFLLTPLLINSQPRLSKSRPCSGCLNVGATTSHKPGRSRRHALAQQACTATSQFTTPRHRPPYESVAFASL
jgi:hypothetical protein